MVLAQEQGYDNEGGAMTGRTEACRIPRGQPLRDGNKWLEEMMHHEDNNMRLTAFDYWRCERRTPGQLIRGMHKLAVEELTRRTTSSWRITSRIHESPDAGMGRTA